MHAAEALQMGLANRVAPKGKSLEVAEGKSTYKYECLVAKTNKQRKRACHCHNNANMF